jgi:hypothetical protein
LLSGKAVLNNKKSLPAGLTVFEDLNELLLQI